MFAAAFIGLTIISLTILARMGAPVPEGLLIVGWRLFGLSLLSVAGFTLPTCSPEATPTILSTMGMITAGLKCVSVG